MLISPRHPHQVHSILLSFIQNITYASPARFAKSVLKVTLHTFENNATKPVSILLVPNSLWKEYSAQFAEKFTQQNTAPKLQTVRPTYQQILYQVQEYINFDQPNLAQTILSGRMESDPAYQADQTLSELKDQIGNRKLAMRIAAAFYGIAILFTVWATSKGSGMIGFGIIFAVMAIIYLIQGKSGARHTALALALLSAGVNVIVNVLSGSILDIFAWGAFGLAMTLLLVGKPNRLRIIAGSAVFAIGSLGVFFFVVFGLTLFPALFHQVMTISAPIYKDDFSKDQGWSTKSQANYAAGREGAAYFMQLNTPEMTYFSFPPIAFFPDEAEVDVKLPAASINDAPGLYGLTCHYQQETKNYYAVYFDPIALDYAIFQIEDQDFTPLTDPIWQPVDEMKEASQTNKIGLICRDGQIAAVMNGTKLPPVSVPSLTQFGDGMMGFSLVSFKEVPSQGFKVLFDNATFWPPR